jgi:purine catabolism regulator
MNSPANDPLSGSVTLSDVIRLALPFGTVVATRGVLPSRPVNWVVVLSDWKDLAGQVKTNDVVVVPAGLQKQVKADQLRARLQELAEHMVVAITFFRTVPDSVTKTAAKFALPLLILPEDSNLREVQRSIAALLLDRQAQTTERGMQLYRQLSELSRDGKGLDAMAELMAKLTGKTVVIQDKRLEIRALAVPTGDQEDISPLLHVLEQREHLPPALRNREVAARVAQNSRTGQSFWQQLLPIVTMGRMISPIISGDRARGYVSVVGLVDELDLLDTLVAEHGAAAAALEMARDKAISEAQKALRGDFLEGLLAGNLPASEIERLERRLDHDTKHPHAVMTVSWGAEDNLSLRRLETAINWLLSSHNRPALVHIYGGDHVSVFQSLRGENDLNTVHEFDRRLREHLQGEYPQATVFSGFSGPADTLHDWAAYHDRALQAMRLGGRLGLASLVEYNSLGVYQLLQQIEQIPTVKTFCEEIIGPLAEYDQRQRGNLVQTIDAYFNFHGNVSQTAEALFVHRNTLLYRLERIQELTGQDLNQADMRLALQLALRLWNLRR